jgi:TRAP-type mannitol/chloroaromatic compound transport system permease small subunit
LIAARWGYIAQSEFIVSRIGESRMQSLLAASRWIDAINERFGRIANWLVLLACAISAGNAFVRYGINMSSNAWLEIQWYCFAGMVMLGASWTLNRNEHVRVDLIYGRLSTRAQVWVDVVGGVLFLLPAMAVLAWTAWPFFLDAWTIGEGSTNAGGLIRWPVKLMLPLGFAMVWLQGLSEIIKRVGYLRGVHNMDLQYERPLQ